MRDSPSPVREFEQNKRRRFPPCRLRDERSALFGWAGACKLGYKAEATKLLGSHSQPLDSSPGKVKASRCYVQILVSCLLIARIKYHDACPTLALARDFPPQRYESHRRLSSSLGTGQCKARKQAASRAERQGRYISQTRSTLCCIVTRHGRNLAREGELLSDEFANNSALRK